MKRIFSAVFCLVSALLAAAEVQDTRNLLLNPEFSFTTYMQHRSAKRGHKTAHYVPFWNADSAQTLTVYRDSHIKQEFRPEVAAAYGVKLNPGGSFHQFFTLPEAELIPGDAVSLSFWGYQNTPKALKAEIRAMKIESEDGTWSPGKDFKLRDKRTFQKMSRGELVVASSLCATSEIVKKCVPFSAENFVIPGNFTKGKKSCSKDNNTVGVEVRFTNTSKEDVWIFIPSLVRGKKAFRAAGNFRKIPEYYRHIPRTMQKLWKGEAVHIVFMGSSIDRGSANPPLYPYDENPASPKYKQPLTDSHTGFTTKVVGREDLDPYFGWSNHYFSCAGRLKVELMKKFDLPGSKILMNFMASDGSCVGEAHSGLKEYCELLLAPSPHDNGHKSGYTWQQLYPELFSRPEGPRPDLVIFGSGANEKTDTPDECAVFEGTIRYIQRNYPNTEFIGCMYQGPSPSPNFSDMRAIALRYGIPCIDFGIINDRVTRNINRNAIGNNDGHPQASIHYLWFKQLEQAFDCAGPILCGFPQTQLPERLMNTTCNWEGEMKHYKADSKRFFRNGGAFIVDDGAFNCWAALPNNAKTPYAEVFVDGTAVGNKRYSISYNLRNSLFRYGRYAFTDRHVVEVNNKYAFSAVDCKQVLNRSYFGVESGAFENLKKHESYKSETGYPYGKYIAALQPGQSTTLRAVGNAFAVAWVDAEKGGTLTLEIDGKKIFAVPTDTPYTFIDKSTMFMENRKGITLVPYGIHQITIRAEKAPVKLMGVYSYDTRANRSSERIIRNFSCGGEYTFVPGFKATPVISCSGNLKLVSATPEKAVFSGSGLFEAVGE